MNPIFYRTLVVSAAILFSGCSKDMPPLPDVPEVDINKFHLLYGAKPASIKQFKSEVLSFHDQQSDVQYRFIAPSQPGTYPLLVFSHGNWSTQLSYEPLLEHWAAQGYVILSLDHDDCCGMANGIMAALRYGNKKLINNRVRDIVILLNHLPDLAASLPQGVNADTSNIAVTGHSFGAFTAQMFAGASIFDTDKHKQVSYEFKGFDLSNIKSVLAISPPGPMFDEITSNSWEQINKPMLITTGTWDVEPNFFPEYQLHQMSFEKAPKGDKYSLLIQGADHYFGNLICRPERDAKPQRDQFTTLLSVSTAFLDAYLKNNQAAKGYLVSNEVAQITANFAAIESK